VATVTCGPGLTQTGTSLMAAARNRSALVVVTGEWPGHLPNTLQSDSPPWITRLHGQ
jgi:thiamine pyrophosphate-dependent acetolactate synthase large subunit-like protein